MIRIFTDGACSGNPGPGGWAALIVRDGATMVPQTRTVLRRGDELLVVTPRKLREETEERLRSVSLSGRLAQWLEADRGKGVADTTKPPTEVGGPAAVIRSRRATWPRRPHRS